jgi:hypothetical protein
VWVNIKPRALVLKPIRAGIPAKKDTAAELKELGRIKARLNRDFFSFLLKKNFFFHFRCNDFES